MSSGPEDVNILSKFEVETPWSQVNNVSEIPFDTLGLFYFSFADRETISNC